jgi:hypothetical protein
VVKRFLQTYESSATRHIALLHSTQFLSEVQRGLVVERQRQVVSALGDMLSEAYPSRVHAKNKVPLTMMLFGMINWMFTWMKPDGELGYDEMAPIVADLFMGGLPAVQPPPGKAGQAL